MTKKELIEENKALRFVIHSMMDMINAIVVPMNKMVDTIGGNKEYHGGKHKLYFGAESDGALMEEIIKLWG